MSLTRRQFLIRAGIASVAGPAVPRFADRVVGMPVRRQALAPGDRAHCRRALGLDPGTPTLLVTGASQGAASLNDLMIALARRHPGVLGGWQVLHLTGNDHDPSVRTAYDAEDWETVDAFVTDEVIDAHAAVGEADHIRRRLADYHDAGLDQVVLGGLTEPDEIRATLAAIT